MEELEALRQKLRATITTSTIVSVFICIMVFIFIPNITVIIFLAVIALIVSSIPVSNVKKKYRMVYKNNYVSHILEDIFDNVTYLPNHGIPKSELQATSMLYTGDRYSSEDYVSATYKDVRFEQSDVHIEEEHESTDSKGHTHRYYVTVFKGRWLIFDFNKTFKANIMVAEKGFGITKVKRFFGRKDSLFKKVDMESAEFNKKFNVYAQNEHEAFYIITPSLMERLSYLEILNSGKIAFCFHQNKLYVGIDNRKDSFEPGSVFKEIDEVAIKQTITDEIEIITQFVDQLKLDNDLYK